ncbi:MAG: alpha/beta hydrolase [Acidobacteria bacterium]|nr:alpha/beta hydrolase [Acidobacteriota bacterium]
MSDTPRHEVTLRKLVYTMPGADAVTVRRDVPYRTTDTGALGIDLYYPPGPVGPVLPLSRNASADRRSLGGGGSDPPETRPANVPAVVFATGFSDAGGRKMLGCAMKEMESYVGWARLVAASGMVAIAYENRDPASDIHAVLRYVRDNAATLGVDAQRIGLMGFSGNGPVTLSALMDDRALACGALCCAFMLDLDGATGVADAQAQWRFVNPCAGKTVDDLPQDLPLFIARAGQDQFGGLNDAIDRFVAKALASNLPLTVVNHPTGPHAFDTADDSETTREIIRSILGFFRRYLLY